MTRQIPHPKSNIQDTRSGTVPQHIAIIMDGNGRWAQKRGFPRAEGHRRGAASLKEAVKTCREVGVGYLTVYAFSTENWKRPKEEVGFLMKLLAASIEKEVGELKKNGVRVRFLGRISMLPADLQEKIRAAEEGTSMNTALNLSIMLSYGGRAEIVDAVKTLVNKGVESDTIDEDSIGRNLYTAGLPDPDLLIRTAGEMRISNFMLWQLAYAEFWVTETLWPDFRKKHLLQAIEDYGKRTRKFGGLDA